VNSRFEDECTETGKLIKVIKGGKNPGTWMHRVVALKFAAWLDPFFEVWVFQTIDKLLFGNYLKIIDAYKETSQIKTQIRQLTRKLQNNQDYQTLTELKNRKLRILKTLSGFNSELKSIF